MTLEIDHLIGIPFKHGTDDCYTLARRFYKDCFNIDLPDFARPDWWWVSGELNLYEDLYKKAGFFSIDPDIEELRIGDAFLVQIEAPVVNHAAMYIGEGKIIHHLVNKMSEVRLYNHMIKKGTRYTIRHPEVPHIVKTDEDFRIEDHLLPHHKQMLETFRAGVD